MRGQTSIEYFVIASMVLMFMVPIWVYVVTTQQQASQELSLSYASNAVKQIADAANLVHSQGSPAKINIKVYIPKGLDNVSVIDKTIIFNMLTDSRTTEVWYTSMAELRGGENIPLNEGYYYLDIISRDAYVEINRTH
jgi:uncharacterized protein (UPF0333 family)